MRVDDARRALRRAALAGAFVALVFLARALLLGGPWTDLAEALLVLGASVIVPLGVALALPADRRPRAAWAGLAFLVPLGGAGAASSLLVPRGALAAGLACAFLVSCTACAALGAARLLAWGTRPREEVAVDVGLASLAVSGAWLVIDRSGVTFMGFAGPIVLMTSVHFVFAGFAAALVAGLAGRVVRAGPARIAWGFATAIVCVGPALVGVGITASPVVEGAAAVVLALGMLALGVVLATAHLPSAPGVRALLVVAGASLLVTMAFATLFALRRVLPDAAPSWERMAHAHGVLNALGFALCGALAFTLLDVKGALPSRARRFGAPFSRLFATGRVGDRFFHARGLVDGGRPEPTGLVDDLAVFRRSGFDPARVHPDVRAFYERTADFALTVKPHWAPGWRTAGRAFRALVSPLGQLGLPVDPVRDDEMQSALVAIDDAKDGRPARGAMPGVRAWVRTYTRTGATVYAAAYTVHVEPPGPAGSDGGGVPYMNIAFPLPLSNMTSVLRMDPPDDARAPGGLALTTLPARAPGAGGRGATTHGDEGVYLVTPLGPVRLPFDETITVWPADGARGGVHARHEMWLWGVRFLVLDYLLAVRA